MNSQKETSKIIWFLKSIMNSKRKDLPVKNSNKSLKIKNDLIEDLRQIIQKTRQSVAMTINASLTVLYWHVGNRIHKEILEEERADYGKKIIANVSKQLASDYGNGFNEKNLRRMMQLQRFFLMNKLSYR